MKNKIIISAIAAMSILIFTGCQNSDVLGNKSIESFKSIIEIEPGNLVDEKSEEGYTVHKLISPDMKSNFFWGEQVGISVAIQPFIEAGLDIAKLPKEMQSGDQLVISIENSGFSNDDGKADKDFEEFVKADREIIGYHAALDHFGVKLGNGNMFEWAQDVKSNDIDIVFVLNPMMLSEYGTDVSKIEGWVYTDVEMMNDDGEKVIEKKLLKPFNLE